MDFAGRTLLGKYRIEGVLGQGGMGTVWKGAHVVTGRKVAIKVLDERFLSNVNVVQRFGREARAASAIQHEGIVEVLDLDQTEEGLPFLVMEFLDGETLSRRIERKGRIAQDEAVRLGTLLLEALQAAHEHGVIHRDLKPDNIFLVPGAGRRAEVVKILDFGISHKDDEAQAKLTMTGSVLGTPHYMSPEQAMGDTVLDRRVDIYGVGVVLYECVVGDVPFDAPNYNKLLRVILDQEAVPPIKRGALIEPRFEAVILSAIAKDRDQRPQTARELLDRMKAATSDERAGDATARLGAGREDASRAGARRTASASFARPQEIKAFTPTPSAAGSGSRGLDGMASTLAGPDAYGFDASGPVGTLDAPRLAPVAPLRADAPAGGAHGGRDAPPGGGLGSLDSLDAGAGFALEIDESALARPARPDPSSPPTARSASSSGQHRAISERALQAAAAASASIAPTRSTPTRTTPTHTTPPRGMAKSSATRSSDSLPAVAAPEAEPDVAPSSRGLRERWDDLPEPVRRWAPIALGGLLLFIAVVAAVRYAVRPGTDDVIPSSVLAAPIDDEAARGPEWVLVAVDGVPPGAQLRLDGLPGASLPLRVRPGSEHTLQIRAPGYQDRLLRFEAQTNTRLRADMRPSIGTTQAAP